ncbi:hypothetical protein C0992_000697, partial [Termitomyces sp. T32_za158]
MQSAETGWQRSLEDNPSSPSSSPTSFDGNTSTRPVTPRPEDDGPKIGSMPVKTYRAVSSELNTISEKLESRLADFHAKISGQVVGPVDVYLFNEFLPPAQGIGMEPDGRAAYQELEPVLKDATNELGMYTALHDNVLSVFNGVDIKPDIVLYLDNDDATIEAMFEVKYNDSDDPFDDHVHGFQRESNESKRTLGLITSYATWHQALEFRTHSFSALIFRTYMRLLRWDRSGVVVTKKTSLDDPFLFDFFHRFTSATTAERGRDCTLTAVDITLPQMKEIWHSLKCNKEAPLLTILVGDKNYIILKDQPPGSTSPIGHSTRFLKAYCLENNMIVLLKDSWRISPTLKPEHEIYARLHRNNVQNIPKVYHGADIGSENSKHLTQTKLWLGKTAKPLGSTLHTLRHYRIVLEYLPFTLEESEIAQEMFAIIRDASIGMWLVDNIYLKTLLIGYAIDYIARFDAVTKAKVLNRDTSNSNIRFKRKQDGTTQGYLVDWDLSLDLDLADEKSAEAQPERT